MPEENPHPETHEHIAIYGWAPKSYLDPEQRAYLEKKIAKFMESLNMDFHVTRFYSESIISDKEQEHVH